MQKKFGGDFALPKSPVIRSNFMSIAMFTMRIQRCDGFELVKSEPVIDDWNNGRFMWSWRLTLWIRHHHAFAFLSHATELCDERSHGFSLSHSISYATKLCTNSSSNSIDVRTLQMNANNPIGVIAKSYFIIAKWKEIRTQTKQRMPGI